MAVAPATVHANPVDIFGLTSRRAGQANSGIAAADDAAALYYDPANLVARPGGELLIGALGAYSHLSINASRASLSDSFGVQLGARTQLPLGGALAGRIAIGLALHLVPTLAARVVTASSEQPLYPQYGDRVSRIVVLPGGAVRITDALAVGVAADVLPVVAEGDQRVPGLARLIAGARYEVSPSLVLGAVYRQRFDVAFDATAHLPAGRRELDVELHAVGCFTPHQLGLGVAYTTDALAASLDLGYALWSEYPGPFLRVSGPLAHEPPTVPFGNTVSVRAGLESTGEGIVFRGGYGLETAAAPVQTGVTNLLDGTKHLVALGAGYVWKRLRVDAHVQLQLVSTRRQDKAIYDDTGEYDPFTSLRDEDPTIDGVQTSNPGYPTMKSGGEVVSGGVTLGISL